MNTERITQLNAQVETNLKTLEERMLAGHTESFLKALDWWAKLHHYSFNNSLLIAIQCRNASVLAGYKKWQALGFQVKSGATAIYIRAPYLKKVADPDTGEITQQLVGYFPVPIFDISQTKEYPDKQPPEFLQPATGDNWGERYFHWCARLNAINITVKEQTLGGNVYGMASRSVIRIRVSLSAPQKAMTLLHEVCHIAANHHDQRVDKPRELRELEAEASTYVIAKTLGESHPAAADYLLHYQIKPDQLRAHLEAIQQIVKRVEGWLELGEERAHAVEHPRAA